MYYPLHLELTYSDFHSTHIDSCAYFNYQVQASYFSNTSRNLYGWNTIVQMRAVSLVQMRAVSLVQMIAVSLVQMRAVSLVQMRTWIAVLIQIPRKIQMNEI